MADHGSRNPDNRLAHVTAPGQLLAHLGARLAIVAAPMAGGPSGPALATAAAEAGGLGFLAGGYRTVDALADQIAATRRTTDRFGVNLFAPNPVPVDAAEFAVYAATLSELAQTYGLDLTGATPREDDDDFGAKIDLLLGDPVPLVSFTFALPPAGVVGALQDAGTAVVQTVTNLDEARRSAAAGVDGLVVQSHLAGGHSGTWDPRRPPVETPLADLVTDVRHEVDLPVWAAGGIATPEDVDAVLAAGAEAAVVGTVLLRTPESGASQTYKDALAAGGTETVVTTAFSGRPARALRNAFVDSFDAQAPFGYPALHHLTSPIRKAAAARGDAGHLNIWAGAGHRHTTDAPAAAVLRRLARGT